MHGASMAKDKIYDRMSADLPINSVVAPAVVDDPLERGAKLKVLRSLRDDPLAALQARDQLRSPDEKRADAATGRDTGIARFKAGQKYRLFHELSQVGTISAIDPTREAVDGGKMRDPLSVSQMDASDALEAANAVLGAYGKQLVSDVLCRGMTFQQIAQARNMHRDKELEFLGRLFRVCLESLAKHWGLA